MKLSLILCSRNDNYNGDSVGRLTTSLNHNSKMFKELDAEIVLTDWGSDIPLSETLDLSGDAREIIRFVYVPPNIAQKYQKDSPFSEVHALNSAARRSCGDYIGRIDQDTLIGDKFIEWFYNTYLQDEEMRKTYRALFSARREMSREQSENWEVTIKDGSAVDILHRTYALNQLRFYKSAVGIFIVEKELYYLCGGYDEEYIYMNYMENNFVERLKNHSELMNLGKEVDFDFFHLKHIQSDGACDYPSGVRKTNPRYSIARVVNPNGNNWGLVGEDL